MEVAILSGKLVGLIEQHSNEISGRVVRTIRQHPELPTLVRGPEPELNAWCQDILSNLGYWLSASQAEEVKRRYEVLGHLRSFILKDTIISFLRSQGFALNSMQLYAEEELEQRLDRFFEAIVYHVGKGYEAPMRVALRMAS